MEGDPAVTGRWGPSVILRPSGAQADALDALTAETLAPMGPGHWATGSSGAAHVTIRALARRDDAATVEHVEALRRAASGPVTLSFADIRVFDAAVVVLATSPDGAADRLRQRYAEELGITGSWEAAVLPKGRDSWYTTLVHTAAPVVQRVTDRAVAIGTETFTEAHVCEWRFDGRRMVPDVLATVPLR